MSRMIVRAGVGVRGDRGTSRSRAVTRVAVVIGALTAGCGSQVSTNTGSGATSPATGVTWATGATGATVPATSGNVSPSVSVPGSTGPGVDPVVNVWVSATVDPTKLPIGDSKVSTTDANVGGLYACSAGNPGAGGASADGPWLNVAAGTWDSTTKLAVHGVVSWPTATYTEDVRDGKRVMTTNNVPVNGQTGTFPIAVNDPAYAYDRNPGTITPAPTTVTIAATGTAAASSSCMSEGAVAMLKNGVLLFNALDGRGDDAVAHESQDLCDGHPAMTTYHYHNVPSCIRTATVGASTVVGWAYDGFPIVLERDAGGALPSNADLDACHGRTSPINVDGSIVTQYHYSVTLEFPYTIGCWKDTAPTASRGGPSGGPPSAR